MEGKSFKDSSTECAICLAPLDDDETIELTCGHRWHFDCLREQLEHAQPNHSRRLLFSGCRCAKCGVFCDHEALRDLTRRTDVLRDKVDCLIREQLQVDAPAMWRATEDKTQLMNEGRRNYAFYLCNSCEEPYFGGTVECADQEEGELPSEDRLCPTCAPQPQTLCRHPLEHRGSHVWKCRYCCNPSIFVCYGTVHFCERCHDRNSQRVRNQQRGSSGPPPLDAIPCPGGQFCPYPKRQGQDHHLNGPSPACEYVYHCAICLSSPARAPLQLEPGSKNFVVNPSGEERLRGWQQFGPSVWAVETSDIPVNDAVTTNFVSSYHWCVMGQFVPLHRFVNNASSVRIEVSSKVMGRTDCPSVFRLEAIVLDSQRRTLHHAKTSEIDAAADFWEKISLVLEPTPGAHEIVIVVCGKDKRFWQGNFGSKVAECSVRVLGSEAELEQVLRQGESIDATVST
jgi:hypothetical protein